MNENVFNKNFYFYFFHFSPAKVDLGSLWRRHNNRSSHVAFNRNIISISGRYICIISILRLDEKTDFYNSRLNQLYQLED